MPALHEMSHLHLRAVQVFRGSPSTEFIPSAVEGLGINSATEKSRFSVQIARFLASLEMTNEPFREVLVAKSPAARAGRRPEGEAFGRNLHHWHESIVCAKS